MQPTAVPSSEAIHPPQIRGVAVLRLGVVLAVTLVAFLSATKAEASCGYYVSSTNPSAGMSLDHSPTKRSNDGSCPCNGPQCNTNQSSQTTPLLSTTTSTFDAAPIVAERSPASESSGVSQVEDSTFLSELHRLLLDPPPR